MPARRPASWSSHTRNRPPLGGLIQVTSPPLSTFDSPRGLIQVTSQFNLWLPPSPQQWPRSSFACDGMTSTPTSPLPSPRSRRMKTSSMSPWWVPNRKHPKCQAGISAALWEVGAQTDEFVANMWVRDTLMQNLWKTHRFKFLFEWNYQQWHWFWFLQAQPESKQTTAWWQ